jgi:cytoskeletal protein RodZ
LSLINDALKRAKHAQQKSPAPVTSPVLRPVEPVRRKQSNLGILLPLALVVLVGVGGIIIWFAMRSGSTKTSPSGVTSVTAATAASAPKPTPKPATAQPVASSAASAPLALAPETTSASVSAPVPASTQAQPASAQPITAPASTTPVATVTQLVVVASGSPPLPKLQGIFYRPERPAALLNGKTVLVGGTSGEYRVVAISQQSVKVVRAGQTNVLNMPD